jgi:hypothetical protein
MGDLDTRMAAVIAVTPVIVCDGNDSDDGDLRSSGPRRST